MGKYQRESRIFQALAHPVRLQILEALASQPMCVCQLVMLTGRRQAYISQQLALLRDVMLVQTERSGSNIFYRVNAGLLEDAMQVLSPLIPVENDDQLATVYQ
ncbi:MAG TPA: metalloregulator ArsR/SmtB family transcription factor [Anaerolineales bacterium]|nr:metalloregulator ArsR/SmtB family transcription factor [Anaerolineales bacterium]